MGTYRTEGRNKVKHWSIFHDLVVDQLAFDPVIADPSVSACMFHVIQTPKPRRPQPSLEQGTHLASCDMFMRMDRTVLGAIPRAHAPRPSSRVIRYNPWIEFR